MTEAGSGFDDGGRGLDDPPAGGGVGFTDDCGAGFDEIIVVIGSGFTEIGEGLPDASGWGFDDPRGGFQDWYTGFTDSGFGFTDAGRGLDDGGGLYENIGVGGWGLIEIGFGLIEMTGGWGGGWGFAEIKTGLTDSGFGFTEAGVGLDDGGGGFSDSYRNDKNDCCCEATWWSVSVFVCADAGWPMPRSPGSEIIKSAILFRSAAIFFTRAIPTLLCNRSVQNFFPISFFFRKFFRLLLECLYKSGAFCGSESCRALCSVDNEVIDRVLLAY